MCVYEKKVGVYNKKSQKNLEKGRFSVYICSRFRELCSETDAFYYGNGSVMV